MPLSSELGLPASSSVSSRRVPVLDGSKLLAAALEISSACSVRADRAVVEPTYRLFSGLISTVVRCGSNGVLFLDIGSITAR